MPTGHCCLSTVPSLCKGRQKELNAFVHRLLKELFYKHNKHRSHFLATIAKEVFLFLFVFLISKNKKRNGSVETSTSSYVAAIFSGSPCAREQ